MRRPHVLPHPVLRRERIYALRASEFRHPFNPNARRLSRSLGDLVGLTRLGVHLVHVAPGDDTTEPHTHAVDEEFVYILRGEALLRLGAEEIPLREGDFFGIAPGHPPHMMTNAGREHLVYLLAGTRSPVELCDYPRRGRRMMQSAGERRWTAHDAIAEFAAG